MRTSPTPPEFRSHLEHHGAGHVFDFIERLRLVWLLRHFPPLLVWSLYVSVNGFFTIALLALLAVVTHTPFVFPSLGPTAYLFFFSPLVPAASPRNAITGHAIALVCGYAALRITGIQAVSHSMDLGLNWPRVIAAALSLAATGALIVLLRANHPPAGATTLIVSLGIISKPQYLVIIEVAVVLLTAQALLINRLAGVPYPLWSAKTQKRLPHA
jgi:CBS domain-containing membrane protein